MNAIIMTVEASPDVVNIGEVRAILNGGSCRIDWGDGTDLPYELEGQELHAQHTYPEKSEEEETTFVIKIYSDEENIIGIYAGCGDMTVKDIDISGCQSIDFSNSTGLEHLCICSGMGGEHKLQSLDLTKCERLQTLGLIFNPDLTSIMTSENSSLQRLVYKNTPLSESTVKNLTRIIERNGGQVIKVSRDDDLDGCNVQYRNIEQREECGGQ